MIQKEKRDNHCVIWTSSYDRGLTHLLDIWGDVKKAVPDATLLICYGWELFNAIFGPNGTGPNPERQAWQAQVSKIMDQPGIKHLGRVGQKEMVKLLEQAGIWAYPTDFDEISCISAMKAQVYGAIPVTMARAALKETVKFGVKIEGDINEPKVKQNYTAELIDMLNKPKLQEELRTKMSQTAKKEFTWKGVAEQFIKEFNA